MAGGIPATFADLLLSTEASYVNAAQEVREAVSYRSSIWKRLLSGKAPEDTLQGGQSIKSFVQLEDANTAHFYGIGDQESPTQPQTVQAWTVPWRFCRTSITWDDEQVALNTAGMGRTARHRELFNLKRQYERASFIDKWKLMERGTMSTPTTDMDSTTSGTTPQSIFGYLVCEGTTLGTGNHPTGFTTVQGIDPDTYTNWRNQTLAYDASTVVPGAPTATTNLLGTLSKMARKVKFDGLPAAPQYADRKTMPSVVYCSLGGLVVLEDIMRVSQDAFVYLGRQDPAYPHPTIFGVPVEYLDYLASATVIDDAGTFHTEDDTSGSQFFGPRYYFLNLEDMTPIFHSEWYMKKHPVLTPYLQPSRHTIYCDTYYNVVCHQRRTQGIVYPDSDLGGAYSAS